MPDAKVDPGHHAEQDDRYRKQCRCELLPRDPAKPDHDRDHRRNCEYQKSQGCLNRDDDGKEIPPARPAVLAKQIAFMTDFVVIEQFLQARDKREYRRGRINADRMLYRTYTAGMMRVEIAVDPGSARQRKPV